MNPLALTAAAAMLTIACAPPVHALDLVKVAPEIYALVGDLGQRSPENLGNNSTHGFVITDAGVVLIDPGATAKGAARIETAIRQVTTAPVIAVINTGGQDHRWLGNGYFKAKGATIIASEAAVTDQRKRFDEQYAGLQMLVGKDNVSGTEPVYAGRAVKAETALRFGKTEFVVIPLGGHTPGDSLVWLPAARVAFAGDVAYTERLLAVLPISQSAQWARAVERLAQLNPSAIVPGHGRPANLKRVQQDTGAYLLHLRSTARDALDTNTPLDTALNADQSAFAYLEGFDLLARRNLQQVMFEMEFE